MQEETTRDLEDKEARSQAVSVELAGCRTIMNELESVIAMEKEGRQKDKRSADAAHAKLSGEVTGGGATYVIVSNRVYGDPWPYPCLWRPLALPLPTLQSITLAMLHSITLHVPNSHGPER